MTDTATTTTPASVVAEHQPLTVTRLVQDRVQLANLALAPDGETFAYVRQTYNKESGKKESQVWLADADGTNRRQITFVGAGNGNPAWSPDGRTLAFTTHREGDEKPFAIALLPMTGGEARLVKKHAMPILSLAWSPDGSHIAYTVPVDPENPDETPRDPKAPAKMRLVRQNDYKLDGIGYRGEIRNQLQVLDVASGEAKQLTRGLHDYMNPRWSPDGTIIAASEWHGNPLAVTLALIDAESGEVTSVGEPGFLVGPPSWSPDGKTVIVDTGLYTTFAVDVATKAVRNVSEDLGFTPAGIFNADKDPIWLGNDKVLMNGQIGVGFGLFELDLTNGEVEQRVVWQAVNGGLNPTPDGKAALHLVSDLDGVEGVARTDLKTGRQTLLFEENRALYDESPLPRWETVSVDNKGVTVEGILLKPADFDPAKRYPVVLDIHGGPQGAHLASVNQIATAYASAGFVVLLPNPRGSSGYGKTFLDGVNGAWGEGDWTDLNALLDSVLAEPWADSDRQGVSGYSYGGFMTSWALGNTDRFKAAVCGAPVFDLESFYGTSDIGYIFGPKMWGGTPWEEQDWVQAHSPSSHIHKAVTPTFIICGENDDRCPIGQSEQLFISLMKLGIDVEFGRYPGGAHGFIVAGEPSHQIDAIDRSVAWLKKYLGDPADA
ncbi:MAG: prolyl oligopeptidase family serine peptidase [Thermomicrobiales bacterium]